MDEHGDYVCCLLRRIDQQCNDLGALKYVVTLQVGVGEQVWAGAVEVNHRVLLSVSLTCWLGLLLLQVWQWMCNHWTQQETWNCIYHWYCSCEYYKNCED